MRPNERRLATSQAIDRALRRMLAGSAISDADVLTVIAALWAGRWVGIDQYHALQRRCQQLAPGSLAARRAVQGLLAQGYHHWLRCFEARRVALAPGLAYKIDHIPKATANNRRPGKSMAPLFLTIHSTGNPASAAAGERNWLTSTENPRTASFHLVVDEKQAIECIPFDEVAWHAGDGNGNGNQKSISLEICESGNRERTLRNAIAVTARILRERDMEVDHLRRHHDWATKLCPRILIVPASRQRPGHTWDWFKREVAQLV